MCAISGMKFFKGEGENVKPGKNAIVSQKGYNSNLSLKYRLKT